MANALITGANRGLGLECARQLAATGHRVFMAARHLETAKEAAAQLVGDVIPILIDVTRPETLAEAFEQIASSVETLEILINNAGVYPSTDANPVTVPGSDMVKTLLTNVAGPHTVTQVFIPLLAAARPNACIVNVSSGLGSFEYGAPPDGEFADYIGTCYATSKAALNMLTLSWAKHLNLVRSPIRINAVSPGWCRTDMGGSTAPRTPEEGAATLLHYAFLPPDGPTGGFFGPEGPLPW
jgi:NAD(P)-dependent dehydrogenase (short-subunit alcohol dehydrogenase family)